MVRHNDPVIEQILLLVKEEQCLGHHIRHCRYFQMAFTHATVEITFNLPLQLALCMFARDLSSRAKRRQPPRLLCFEFKKHFPRQ